MSNKFKSKTIIGGLLLCSLAIGAGAFADHDNMIHHSHQRVSLASKNDESSELSSKVKKARNIMEEIKPVYDKQCTHGGSTTWHDTSFINKIQGEIKQLYSDSDALNHTGKFSPKYHHYNESYDAHLLAGLYDGISNYYYSHKSVSNNWDKDINKVPTVHQDVLGKLEPFPWKKMKENDLQMGPKTAAKTYFGQVKASAPGCNVMYNHVQTNKSTTDGNFHSGSPIHNDTGKYPSGKLDPYGWDYNEFPNNANGQYSAYIHRGYIFDWSGIDLYHTQLADRQLQERQKDGRGRKSIQVVMPRYHAPQSIEVAYPHSVKVTTGDNSKPQYADVELKINHIHYYGNTSKDNNKASNNEWRDSYKDGRPKYQKGNPSNKSFVFSKNIGNGFRFNGVTSFDASYKVTDSKTGKPVKLSHAYIGVDHIDGEAAYQYHSAGFSGRTAEQDFRNNEVFMHTGFHTADPTGQFVDSMANNMTPYSYDKKTNERKIAINPIIDPNRRAIGGLYGKSYRKLQGKDNNTSKELDHAVIFNLNNSNNFDINAGSSTGYGLLRPFSNIKPPKTKYICKKYTYKEPTGMKSNPSSSTLIKYINIVINRDGQNSKAIPLSDFVGKNAKQHVNQTMFKHTTVDGQTNGDGGNYKKATILVGPKKKQYREFKNDKQAVKWASNINCLVIKPPKPQPCKQGSKQCPTQKFQKTVMKKGPDGSIHVPDHKIEDNQNGDYYQGGILKHPNQKFDYKIHGQLPLLAKQAYYYKYYTDNKGHTQRASTPTYYDDLRDNFVLNDTIPSEVKMLGVPQMKVNGHSVSATSGMSHNMQFKFDEQKLATLQSGGTPPTYDVYIPVEAAPKSGSNKDFDSSQRGYGLPDVTGSNYQHWLQFLNKSNFSSDIHVGHHGSTNEPDSKKSNALVEIKEIKAAIYNYNYNHDYFPNSEQPYGFNSNNSCDKTSTDPTNKYYKDYRYHKYFRKRNIINKDKKPILYYGYVNSDFAVRSLKQDQGNHNGQNGTQQWRYRLVYPSLSAKGYLPATKSSENNNNVWNINSQRYKLAKKFISDDWSKKDPNYWADNDNDQNALPMVFNPDDTKNHCGNDAYTSSGFSQTNYIPYIVPHISFVPEIPNENKLPKAKRLDRDGQLIVDTDTAKHGLPFRFNMRAQNVLYGYHFWEDFKDDNQNPDTVTMHITAGKGGPELYKATRRLVGNKSNALARFNGYKHQHYVTKDEWPKGNHNWTGYNEKNAFKLSDNSKYKSDYNLDTSKLNLKKGQRIPLHVYFTATGLARISYKHLNSHAYNAARPKVMRKDNKSFGYNHNVSDGSDSVKGNNNPNKSTYIEPERTVKYFGESPYSYDKQVRELKEELNVTQPHYAYGKTGYGMTANDLGISYAGHLEEPHYVHKGTNMTYAFPSPFQKKDTQIKYSNDNRHSEKLNATIYKNDNKSTKTAYKRLADVLLHVEPHSQSHQVTTSNDIDNGMPSNLDDPDGIKYYADADNYYGDFLNKEHLWSGKFATSYGFYPRQATHNVRTSSNGTDSNGGDITIAPHGPSGIESKRYDDKPISDVKMFGDLPHTMNGFNGYGLNGVKTSNGMTHDFNTITKSQGVKDAQNSNEDIEADGQDERMFTPIFMNIGSYSTNFHRSYRQMNRKHRLGGNFFDIDENRPIKFYGHIYIGKNSKSKGNDEFSLQPILSNTKNGISQTPSSAPLFPNDWLSSADGSMAPNWYDAKIFAKKHKHHGHKRWSMNIGTHQKELEKKY